MPELTYEQLKKATAKAVEESVKKEGQTIFLKPKLGGRLEADRPIHDISRSKLKSGIVANVKKILRDKGFKVATLVRERQQGKVDIILTGDISPSKVYVGLKIKW